MIISVPREIKLQEFRVALTPEGVAEFVKNGHTVFVEKNAGAGSSITDQNYLDAGALQIANLGWEEATKVNPDLAKGLNTHDGKVTFKAVAEAHGYEFSPVF